MMKRTLPALCIAMMLLAAGCGGQTHSELIAEARGMDMTQEIPAAFTEDNYGTTATAILESIQQNYPGRIAGSEKEKETALFVLSVLLNGGYSEKNINVQPFSIPTAAPAMEAGEAQIFDGGEQSGKSRNIEAVIEGKTEKTIVIGAHYDSAGTHGVDDNGSGVSVALESALRMANAEPGYTIRYVFFGAEEIGMCGSRAYVEQLSKKDKENIVLMINIDSVLAGDHMYIYGGRINPDGKIVDTEPVMRAAEIADESGLAIQLVPEGNEDYPYPTGQKRSDHAPFSDAGIPYVYFEANNWETGSPIETQEHGLIMHTERDDLAFIEKEYGERGRNALAAYSKLLHAMLKEHDWEKFD